MSAREVLANRQREVLHDLLAGRVPEGFDPMGSALTTRVLHRKRSSAALHACPELGELAGWRERFHAYAAATPLQGCAHDDVRRFAGSLSATDPDWVRMHDVHERRRAVAWVRVGGRRELLVRVGSRIVRFTSARGKPWAR